MYFQLYHGRQKLLISTQLALFESNDRRVECFQIIFSCPFPCHSTSICKQRVDSLTHRVKLNNAKLCDNRCSTSFSALQLVTLNHGVKLKLNSSFIFFLLLKSKLQDSVNFNSVFTEYYIHTPRSFVFQYEHEVSFSCELPLMKSQFHEPQQHESSNMLTKFQI